FRYSFTPLPGYFSPFPHGTIRYRSPGSIQAYRVVPADSQQIPRARCYSGNHDQADTRFSRTGLSPTTAGHPRPLPLTACFLQLPAGTAAPAITAPQPHTHNPCRVSHAHGLASSAFARHYSQNHSCFLFLRVLRCFTSPRSLHTAYTFSGG